MKRFYLALRLALLAAASAYAHDPGLSTTQAVIRADSVVLTLGFAPADLQALLPASSRIQGGLDSASFESARQALEALAPQLWEIGGSEHPSEPRSVKVELAEKSSVMFELDYPRPPGVRLDLRSLVLDRLPPGHRDFLTVVDEHGATILETLASAKEYAFQVALAAPPAPTFWGFLKLGVEHIWTGYDHLLFLFGLLIVCRRFKSIVAIISCFTIAHSVTLALATLKIVNIPSRFTEPAIAASIVFVGVENLLRGGTEPGGRWMLTFCFGLIHGFGFASALSELGVGADGRGIALPLLTFNLGVEVGQITIAAIVLPVVWQLRKNASFVRIGVPVLSAIVAAAGLYWFLQRTVFS